MDRERALEIQRNALHDWVGALGSSSPGAQVFDDDGVRAAAVPATPQRSIANSVTYRDADRLRRSLDDLSRFYEDAGIAAWTVWVPEFESETIGLLERAGHRFDGQPMAMVLDLAAWRPGDVGDLDWSDAVAPGVLGRLNDLAYGVDPGSGFAPSLAGSAEHLRLLAARVDGEPACVLGTIDHSGADVGVYFVATDPRLQGRGLATRLITVALAQARERGMRTASLQASGAGEPIYTRLGFEACFRLHMYERREPGADR